MNWSHWHKHYDSNADLQARLHLVGEQISRCLHSCPAGRIRVVSVCAGDGRDLIGALINHPRRNDVEALLLDNDRESIERGRRVVSEARLEQRVRLVEADAGRAENYASGLPSDILILSGFLGHLRPGDVENLIHQLPMFCRRGSWVIWSRHLVLNQGPHQVRAIQECFRKTKFESATFSCTSPDGFAVGAERFQGEPAVFDANRVLFEFIGLDRLTPIRLPEPMISSSRQPAEDASSKEAGSAGDPFEWNANASLDLRFRERVDQQESRIACLAENGLLTYAGLSAAAGGLARELGSVSSPGDRIALLMKQDCPLVAAILGVIRAGRMVVVLNPTDPPARLAQIFEDASPSVLVTDRASQSIIDCASFSVPRILCYEPDAKSSMPDFETSVDPDDRAWLIYTSGTTGRPKGVIQTHRNILHNALRLAAGMQLTAEDRVAMLASPSGGQGVSTLWSALLTGATLCPFPSMDRGVVGLKEWLMAQRITVLVASVSVFRALVRTFENGEILREVRLVRFGSETASASDLAAVGRHFGEGCVVLNSFSSSETGNITQQRLLPGHVMSGRLPVGRPVAGMEVLLVDESGRESSPGEPGEVLVRSRYLSPGYWGNEALTQERFSMESGSPGVRIFRSGDLARRGPDGALIFLERRDLRVKIHGYRVELCEVEDALARQPSVDSVVVSTETLQDGQLRLVAHIVLRSDCAPGADELRRRLREELPAYMVPGAFVFLDHFPLTPHGKVDRRALPAAPPPGEASRRLLKPRDVVERSLAKIFESVLGVSPVGRNDDFFDLGGTSIRSVEALAAIEEMFNVALPPSTLVERSTVEKLAPLLADHAVIPSTSPLVTLRESDTGRPLFLIHSGQGDVVTYGLMARRLKPRPVYGLQAPGVQGEQWPLMSVHDMAEHYLPEILAKDPAGPYLLAGTCMGGMVAFELARRLAQRGSSVSLVALIDSPTAPYSGRRPAWHERFLDPLRDSLRIARWGILRVLGTRIAPARLPAYRRFVAGMTGRANRRYHPQFYPGKIVVIITADTPFPAGDRRGLIARHAKEARTIVVPGTRPGLFARPQVEELVRVFDRCLDEAESSAAAIAHQPTG